MSFKTVAQTVGRLTSVATDASARPAARLRLTKHDMILNVGEQLREEKDREFDERCDKAVHGAIEHERELAAAHLRDSIRQTREDGRRAVERALAAADAQSTAKGDEYALFRDQQEVVAVQTARDEEIAAAADRLQQRLKEAAEQQAEAVKRAAEASEVATLKRAATAQAEAVKRAEDALQKVTRAEREAAVNLVRQEMVREGERLQKVHATRMARVLAMCEDEQQAVAALEEQLKQAERCVVQADIRYDELYRTHQRTLAISLMNYDDAEPWLP
jgi:hypothetical protein